MKRYPCVGGPLNGVMVTSDELRPEVRASRDFGNTKAGDIIVSRGIHGRHGNDYFRFNRGDSWAKVPTMVWLHRSLLEPAGK